MMKRLMVGIGGGLAVLAYRLFMRWGIPAFVEKIATDPRLPLKAKLTIRDCAPVLVELVERIGVRNNWKGEAKTKEVLARIAVVLGNTELKEEEEKEARCVISSTVTRLNRKAGTVGEGLSFADFVERVRSAAGEGGGGDG